jgi:predicted acyltransferase
MPAVQTKEAATTATVPKIFPSRLLSLDALRGLTIAGMILVTDPGTYSAVFPPLHHAAWQGVTPTDMIFPTFLFIVGVSLVFSLHSRLSRGATSVQVIFHILRRTFLLIVLGLLVNGFPFYDLHHLRIPGILQRIALCYAAASLLYLGITSTNHDAGSERPSTPVRTIAILAGIIATILIGYWALLRLVSVPGFGAARYDSLGYLGAYIDRNVFGVRHLWAWGLTPGYGVTYDPEGILSTLPALTNTLLGVLVGVGLGASCNRRIVAANMILFGTLLFAVSWPLSALMPVNKRIWTSTFALLSGGVSLLALGILYRLMDCAPSIPRWLEPMLNFARIFGTNAIAAFVLSSIITAGLDAIYLPSQGVAVSLHQAGYQYLFASWLPSRIGSLAYALAIVALNAALLYPLYRKRIFLRL